MRRLLAFVAATGFAGLAMASPFADMTPDKEYVSPEEMAVAIAAAATNQAASAAAVAVAATNHTDAVGAAVAVAATNHADAVGAAVAVAATNHADAVGAAVAQAATNHADAVGAAVAQAATNHADAVGAAVAVAATNHADAVSAAVAQAATNYTDEAVARISELDPVFGAWLEQNEDDTGTCSVFSAYYSESANTAYTATSAESAEYAYTAGTADSATTATTAESADYATNAAIADRATTADTAERLHLDDGSTDLTGDEFATYAAGKALAEAPGVVSNIVTKTYVESLGIEAGIDGAGVSNIVDGLAVTSVNGKTGTVSLVASDIGAISTSGGSITGTLAVNQLNVSDRFGRTEYHQELIRAYVLRADRYVTWYFPSASGTFSRLEDLAGEFDPTVQYQVGDLVIHSDYGQLFRCTVAHSGEWDDDHFAEASVADALANTPAIISNTVTKVFIEDLGISGGLPPGIDIESLERAIQVGEDLVLIDAQTNGWVIAVSNIVEVGDAHIPGTLFVGGRIYGVPTGPEGRVEIDGCDFFYNRQIPGDTTQTNGYGNLVTDPYLDWRLAQFFADYNAETTRMWNQVATINNLPDTLDDDLRTYNSVTSNLEAATMEVNLVRDEVNMTNAVMRAAFDRALAEAASSGEGWSATNATDECLILTDHGVTTCSASTSSYYIMLPSWTGTPAHCLAWFDNAAAWSDSPPSFYTSSAGAVYVDEALPAEFHAGGGKYLFDFRQLDEDTWFLSVHPAGVGSLGGNAR